MANHPISPHQTVKFYVGGKIFETARTLIDQHEDTMLARLVSDTWQEDPHKPVFIDRNGDIFALVLDYLRYGSIVLPITISKEMFIRDLDFYGIVPDGRAVMASSEGWAEQAKDRNNEMKELAREKNVLEATFEKEKAKLEARRLSLLLKNDIEFLANYCANQNLLYSICRVKLDRPDDRNNTEDKANKHHLLEAARAVKNNSVNADVFRASLSKFGLCMVEIEESGYSCNYFVLTLSSL